MEAIKNIKFPYVMCQDTLTRQSSLERMTQKSPVKLVQSYYACNRNLRSALLASLGISFSVATLFVTGVWLLLGGFVSLLFNNKSFRRYMHGWNMPTDNVLEDFDNAYSTVEKEKLLGVFSSLKALADSIKTNNASSSATVAASCELSARLDAFSRDQQLELIESAELLTPEQTNILQRVGQQISQKLSPECGLLHAAKEAVQARGLAPHRRITIQLATHPPMSIPPETSTHSQRLSIGGALHPLDLVLKDTRLPDISAKRSL